MCNKTRLWLQSEKMKWNQCSTVKGELSVAKFLVKSFKRAPLLGACGFAPLALLYPKCTTNCQQSRTEPVLANLFFIPHSFFPIFQHRQNQRFWSAAIMAPPLNDAQHI